MTPNKPEVFEVYRTKQGTLENVVLLTDYEATQAECERLVEALEGLLKVTDESLGVSGYHLNGNMAKWCEFEEVEMAEEVLALYRKQKGDA